MIDNFEVWALSTAILVERIKAVSLNSAGRDSD